MSNLPSLFYHYEGDGRLLRIAGVIQESVVDGPGLRYVIFTQGCPHKCRGCHNPETHDFHGGYNVELSKLVDSILETRLIQGITISGGEPFAQAIPCYNLIKMIKSQDKNLDILVYTGYYHKQLINIAKIDYNVRDFLQSIDILIDGPFELDQKTLTLPFRGSKNQNIIFMP